MIGEIELGAAAEATVHAYKELANDPTKRLPLALDQTCIQFLAYVIAEGAGTLVQGAVDTLQLLADSPECRPSLANTYGVLEALQEMADDARYSEELRNHAASLFTCLNYSKMTNEKLSPSEDKENEGCSGHHKMNSKISLPSQDSLESVNSTSERSGISFAAKNEIKVAKEKNFLGPYNSKAKTVTLYIERMRTQGHRKQVEEELVRVRGLISIVFDLSKSRVTCRVKRDLGIDKLAAAVSRTEMCRAQQVITGPEGEELIVDIGSDKPNPSPTIDDLPEYLPEEDTPVKDASSAMAPSGSFREAASSFISAAADLLQSSFYW